MDHVDTDVDSLLLLIPRRLQTADDGVGDMYAGHVAAYPLRRTAEASGPDARQDEDPLVGARVAHRVHVAPEGVDIETVLGLHELRAGRDLFRQPVRTIIEWRARTGSPRRREIRGAARSTRGRSGSATRRACGGSCSTSTCNPDRTPASPRGDRRHPRHRRSDRGCWPRPWPPRRERRPGWRSGSGRGPIPALPWRSRAASAANTCRRWTYGSSRPSRRWRSSHPRSRRTKRPACRLPPDWPNRAARSRRSRRIRRRAAPAQGGRRKSVPA